MIKLKKNCGLKNDFFYSLMSRYKEHHQFPSQILKRELLSACIRYAKRYAKYVVLNLSSDYFF